MSATSTQTSIDFALGIPLRLKCSPLPRHVESREVASLLEGDRTFLEDLGGRIALKAPQVKVEVTRKEGNAWAGELWSARGEVSGVRFVVEAVPSDFEGDKFFATDDVARKDYANLAAERPSLDAKIESQGKELQSLRVENKTINTRLDQLEKEIAEGKKERAVLKKEVAGLKAAEALAHELEVQRLTTKVAAIMALEAAFSHTTALNRKKTQLTRKEKLTIDKAWCCIEDTAGWQDTAATIRNMKTSFNVEDENDEMPDFFAELPPKLAEKVRLAIEVIQKNGSSEANNLFNTVTSIMNDEQIRQKRKSRNLWAHDKPDILEVRDSLRKYRPATTEAEISKTVAKSNFASAPPA